MNLDDLRAEVKICCGDVDKEEDDELEEYEETTEAELSNSLSLLEDCHTLFEAILKNKRSAISLKPNLEKKIENLSLEVIAFILQYDVDEEDKDKLKDKDWRDDL